MHIQVLRLSVIVIHTSFEEREREREREQKTEHRRAGRRESETENGSVECNCVKLCEINELPQRPWVEESKAE